MSEPAIRFEDVAKRFEIFDSSLRRLRSALVSAVRTTAAAEEVLRGASFSVARGESVGIVGPNGAGKSTILQLIAGVLEPSSGSVTVRGQVMSLLDLGGTFLPELTGRENAHFLHEVAAADGALSAEREHEIQQFAGIGSYFDRPVHTYSSGMFLRLAFACAAFEEPDILLVDEVLAVGDAAFQQKCFRRLQRLRESGTTIVLVTHYVHLLGTLSDRVLVLDRGEIVFDGPPRAATDRYYQIVLSAPEQPAPDGSGIEFRYGEGGARIGDPVAAHADPHRSGAFRAGDRVSVSFEIDFERAVDDPQIGLACCTTDGLRVYATNSALLGEAPAPARAGARRRAEISFEVPAAVVDLFIDLSIHEFVDGRMAMLDARMGVLHVRVVPATHFFGIADLSASMRLDGP